MMKVIPLGAGQEVGRSCIIVHIRDKTVMLDCGMHMGYSDERKFPDFSYLSETGNFRQSLDCIIISHFHLDHCGALPYFTEVLGYDGPIFMTHPTKSIIPILLEDFKKICKNTFSSADISSCMSKITSLNIKETFDLDGLIIKPYYAGHVLGAAMFYVEYAGESLVYTGDYNLTPDRHLRAASIEVLHPDLLITESTYGSVIREDCRKSKERIFLQEIYKCVSAGGKVLIPTNAMGRAQEMCLLVDNFWDTLNLSIPVYLSSGMTDKANEIYKLYISYTNDFMQNNIAKRNLFNYKHIRPLDKINLVDGPMVVFASPGMLHSGVSLNVFKDWCEDEKNLVIIPGYCVKGTVGFNLINKLPIKINNKTYDVKIQVIELAFSAHADEMGIMSLIDMCKPRNVMLVHGDERRINELKPKIHSNFNIDVFSPCNGTLIDIPAGNSIKMAVKTNLLESTIESYGVDELHFRMTVEKNDQAFEVIDVAELKNCDEVCNIKDT